MIKPFPFTLLFLALGPAAGIGETLQESTTSSLSGQVVDQSGLPVDGAQFQLRGLQTGWLGRGRSLQDGRFLLSDLPPDSYELLVEAEGFAEHQEVLQLRAGQAASVLVRLRIPTLTETLTVTPTRTEQKIGNLAASVNVLTDKEIAESPALVLDDALRQMPSFSLFRRSSSLASHPTSQGVSLRGIGPSGVSRTLVLMDGFPFNDPFGGWVYWSRVPMTTLSRVEVVEGPSSNLYGNFAMGGVIHILSRQPTRRTLLAEGRLGTHQTAKLDLFASDRWGPWGVSLDGSIFHTDGYKILAEDERGQVDTEANSENESLNLKIDYSPSEDFNFFIKGSYSDEDRNNGTLLQENDTQSRFVGGGLRFRTPDDSEVQLSLFSHFQNFGSTFSAVAPDRNSERLSLSQEVPSKGWGGFTQWSKPLGSLHLLTAGFDWRWIDGDSEETVFILTPPVPVRRRIVGGRQRSVGVFLQDSFNPLPSLQVLLSARFDHWRNYRALSHEVALFTGQTTDLQLPDKDNGVVSGRAGLLYHWTESVSTWGAVGTGFRAPTLNELYRQFRVGDVITLANSDLGPERLVGTEGGLNFAVNEKVFWRISGFWNRVKDPVSNVTLTVTPELITRQRQNLGQTRTWGLQTEVTYRPNRRWKMDGAYLFNRSTVQEFPANPLLEGNRLPQVPKHRVTLGVTYAAPSDILVALRGRLVSAQFDDDLNLLPLGSYLVVDLTASKKLGEETELFLAVENLLDREYPVRTNPRSIGAPILVQGGLRFRLQ